MSNGPASLEAGLGLDWLYYLTRRQGWFPVALGLALAGAAIYARLSRSRTAMFNAILALVVVQVLVLLAAVAVAGP